jgi:hypothetical protein
LCGSGTSSAVTRCGPVGAKVSNVLPTIHCFWSFFSCRLQQLVRQRTLTQIARIL